MELRELNLTAKDIVKNLDGDKRTREYTLSKIEERIPKGEFSKRVYYTFKDAMYTFLKGILKEEQKLEEALKIQDNDDDRIIINDALNSRKAEFEEALLKLGKEVVRYGELRDKMRSSSNEEKMELLIQGVDYSVLEIKFEREM